MKTFETSWGGRPLIIETGKMAKQANGSVLVRYGETVVLVTATASKKPLEGADFLPLTVNYQEMRYAAGKFPGGFFKREARPTEKDVLTSRLIDRPLRPLFPKGYSNETQIIATVLSADKENDPDIAALVGASVALEISDIPFNGPIAGVRVGRVDGEFICNPTPQQLSDSDIDLIVAANKDSIVMVEGGAKVVPEDIILDALIFAHDSMKDVFKLQEDMKEEVGKEKRPFTPPEEDQDLTSKVLELSEDKIKSYIQIPAKLERYAKLDELSEEVLEAVTPLFEEREKEIKETFGKIKKNILREYVLTERKRIDGRGLKDIRPISSEVGILPRTHGSSLFTRGETQTLVVTTLGTSEDEQKVDTLLEEHYKKFMLHYNFPPFCVGEVRFLRGPGRREIGHGALAERALLSVLPDSDEFPYTVRLVSEVLESNGSSSMASVCGGSMALMDAGVPIKSPVAGIAMGLIKEGDQVAILTDILGDEDHLGDMDFKVTGTNDGITALQMDIKADGLTKEILRDALYQAREARLDILQKMTEAISVPRTELSSYAPRILTITVKQEKIKDVIGPGGKNIKFITSETGVKIDIEDSGKINIASADEEAINKAIAIIRKLTQEAEIGKIYSGTVRKIVDFGAFVEIFPGTDGLVHISQLSDERVRSVSDVLNEGDEVQVKVLDIDKQGRIRLSRKAVLNKSTESTQDSE
ncbi:MAG: polyribonucleotide nucleotidyltransferase [Thermodesulfobacteriota bacterium]